jgi:cytochrome c oxidase subunit IV
MILLILIYVVVDDLGSAVGKLDLILSLDSIAVSYFGLGVNVRVTVFIIFLDSIAVFIVVRFFFFMVGSRMMRSRFISRSGVIRSRMIRGWGIWWRGTITAN